MQPNSLAPQRPDQRRPEAKARIAIQEHPCFVAGHQRGAKTEVASRDVSGFDTMVNGERTELDE